MVNTIHEVEQKRKEAEVGAEAEAEVGAEAEAKWGWTQMYK